MSDQNLGVAVGELRNEIKQLKSKKSKTSSKRSTKKKPSKKKSGAKKWKLVRQTGVEQRVLYQKYPKKGYLLIVKKNAVVRDTTENRAKYSSDYITLSDGTTPARS